MLEITDNVEVRLKAAPPRSLVTRNVGEQIQVPALKQEHERERLRVLLAGRHKAGHFSTRIHFDYLRQGSRRTSENSTRARATHAASPARNIVSPPMVWASR